MFSADSTANRFTIVTRFNGAAQSTRNLVFRQISNLRGQWNEENSKEAKSSTPLSRPRRQRYFAAGKLLNAYAKALNVQTASLQESAMPTN